MHLVNAFCTAWLLVTHTQWQQHPSSPKSFKTHLGRTTPTTTFMCLAVLWLKLGCVLSASLLARGSRTSSHCPVSVSCDAQDRLVVLELLEAGAELLKPLGAAGIIHNRISLVPCSSVMDWFRCYNCITPPSPFHLPLCSFHPSSEFNLCKFCCKGNSG